MYIYNINLCVFVCVYMYLEPSRTSAMELFEKIVNGI